jgi:hypothetical protein
MADKTPTPIPEVLARYRREHPDYSPHPAQCAYPGFPAKTADRLLWTYLSDWPGGLPDGYYCPAHCRRY